VIGAEQVTAALNPTARPGVAIVGARDENLWSYLLFTNLQGYGNPEIWPVSRSRPTVRDLPTFGDLADVPRRPEVAVLIVNSTIANSVVKQAVDMDVPHIVLISDGYAERGTREGIALQAELVELVSGSGSRLYGPNGVGFADFRAGIAPLGAPVPLALKTGPVSVISQSGSLTSSIMGGLVEDGIGVDWCVSLGNGAAFDVVDAIEATLDSGTTTVIAAYIESFGRTGRAGLEAVLDRARRQNVTIVLAKSGGSAVGAAIAKSHTAALAGPDRLVDEVLTEYGVIRARSLEDVTRAAAIASYVNPRAKGGTPPRGSGVAVIETSGGAAALTADLLNLEHVGLATFGAATEAALAAVAPDGAYVSNPIDLTASPKPYDDVTSAFRQVYEDPAVRAVVIPFALTFPIEDDERQIHKRSLDRYADLGDSTGTPTIVSTLSDFAWTDWAQSFRDRHPDTLVVRGIASTARMLARLFPEEGPAIEESHGSAADELSTAPNGQVARDLLESLQVPMPAARFVPVGELASVATVAAELTFPLVVKIVADGLLHKVKVGGVVLGCATVDDTAAAAQRVVDSGLAAGLPTECVRGVLLEETGSGDELFVSLNRDPWYGAYVIVGSGGGNVEEAGDSKLIALPTDAATVLDALAPLKLPSSQRSTTATLVARLGDEFVAGGLQSWSMLELNPVMVDAAAGPQILDIVLLPIEPDSAP
jgi:acyl-CoA synthetase (NDP forming)